MKGKHILSKSAKVRKTRKCEMRKHAEIRKMRKCNLESVCGSIFIILYPSNFYPYWGLLNPDHPWSVVVRKTKMGMDCVMRSKEKV